MAETFESLTARIQAQDPTITPQELEKLIAHCVGEMVGEILSNIVIGPKTVALQEAIRERFNLPCEIAPAMSIYVNILNETELVEVTPFSSLPFEEEIKNIMEKDFSAMTPQDVLALVSDTVNNGCDHFLDAIIFSNHELLKLFKQFMQTFDAHITVIKGNPLTLYAGDSLSPLCQETPQTFGNYL